MADSGLADDQLWESGWEGHSLAQRRRLARLPLTAKLEWLEQAQRLVQHLRREPPRRAEESGPSRD